MEPETIEKLKCMLGVPIDKVDDKGEELVIYVPKDQIARAIGSNGAVIRSAELVLKKKLTVEESK